MILIKINKKWRVFTN